MIGNPSSDAFCNKCPQFLIEMRKPNNGNDLQDYHKPERGLVSDCWIVAVMCGPSIDYPTNDFLQDKGTADVEDVERRIRASGNLFWKILCKN